MADAMTVAAPLAPSSKWVVDYQVDMCVASRQFGADPHSVLLTIEPATDMASSAATLYFIAAGRGRDPMRNGKLKLALQPSGATMTVPSVSAGLDGRLHAYMVYAWPELMAKIAQSTSVELSAPQDEFILATGKVQPVVDALGKCNENLFKSWGFDPTMRAEPLTNPAQWYSSSDYPDEARRVGASGRTTVVVTVASNGSPSACRVVGKAGSELLDKTACERTMARGRFVTSSGTASRYSVLSIRWQLADY